MGKLVIKEVTDSGEEVLTRIDTAVELIGSANEEIFVLYNVKHWFKTIIMKNLYPNKEFELSRNIKFNLTVKDIEFKGIMYFSFSGYFANIDIIKNGKTITYGFSVDNALGKPEKPMKDKHLEALIELCLQNHTF